MKTIQIILAVIMLPLGTLSFTSCATTSATITSAQAWLNDPKNQELINNIASTAITLITSFAANERGATTRATVVARVAVKYPDVPAGAIVQITQNPHQYMKH